MLWNLIVHGWGKILRGGTVTGWTLAFGLFLTFIEFVGGICITIGLFTRFFAAAVTIEMAYLTSAVDRGLLIGNPDKLARGVADGVQAFLSTLP